MPLFLSVTLGFFLLVGLALVPALVLGWQAVTSRYRGHRVKYAVESVQTVAAVVALCSTYAGDSARPANAEPTQLGQPAPATQPTRQDYWWPAVIGWACAGVWKLVQVAGDQETQSLVADLRNQVERANRETDGFRRQALDRTKLLTILRDPVNRKRQRVLDMMMAFPPGRAPSIRTAELALVPKNHIGELLMAFAVFLRHQLPESEESQHRNFRIGLYVEDDGALAPIHGVSHAERKYDPFSSYARHRERFRLDAPDDVAAHAVIAVRKGELVIVSDCLAEAAAGRFAYFNDRQKAYLRSLMACPISPVLRTERDLSMAALVVDTDAPGFFRNGDRQWIKFYVEEFAARVALELCLLALVKRRR